MVHDVYREHLIKPELSKLLEKSSRLLATNDGNNYRLDKLGVLCTSDGEKYLGWLQRWVGFMRDAF